MVKRSIFLGIIFLASTGLQAVDSSLGPISQAFIRYTLKSFDYDQKDINTVILAHSSEGFAFRPEFRHILVPFNDTDIIWLIQKLPAGERNRIITGMYNEGVMIDLDRMRYANLRNKSHDTLSMLLSPLAESNNCRAINRIYRSWQAGLLHEMGHFTNDLNFPRKQWFLGATLFASAMSVKYGLPKGLNMLAGSFIAGAVLNFFLSKRNEYYADKEVIKRATLKNEPAILEAEGYLFKVAHVAMLIGPKKSKIINKIRRAVLKRIPILLELMDVHPRHSVRAAYFQNAYEKLECTKYKIFRI